MAASNRAKAQVGASSRPQTALTRELICPRCEGLDSELERPSDATLRCVNCKTTFPVIAGTIPVLLKESHPALSRAYAELLRMELDEEGKIERLRSALERKEYRAERRSVLISVHEANCKFLRRMRNFLEDHVNPEQVLRETLKPKKANGNHDGYVNFFPNLIRDWGSSPEGEEEVEATVRAIKEQLSVEGPIANKDFLLVLGAGSGRFASELSSGFDRTLATDLSVSMGISFLLGGSGEKLDISNINEKDTISLKEHAQKSPHRLKKLQASDKVTYCISNFLDKTLKAGSVSAIASIFFTDVVDPIQLILRVRSLLRTGGKFTHFGPLHYHFDDATRHLSFEELVDEFKLYGFSVSVQDPMPMLHCWDGKSLFGAWYKNCRFTAIKREIEPSTILRIRGDARVSGKDGQEAPDGAIKIDRPGLPTVDLTGTLAALLTGIDGKRTAIEVLEFVFGSLQSGRAEQFQKARALLEELLGTHVIEFK